MSCDQVREPILNITRIEPRAQAVQSNLPSQSESASHDVKHEIMEQGDQIEQDDQDVQDNRNALCEQLKAALELQQKQENVKMWTRICNELYTEHRRKICAKYDLLTSMPWPLLKFKSMDDCYSNFLNMRLLGGISVDTVQDAKSHDMWERQMLSMMREGVFKFNDQSLIFAAETRDVRRVKFVIEHGALANAEALNIALWNYVDKGSYQDAQIVRLLINAKYPISRITFGNLVRLGFIKKEKLFRSKL